MSAELGTFAARVVLRPRSLGETQDLALLYLRTHARDFLPLTLTLTALGLLPAIVGAALLGLDWEQTAALTIVASAVLERAMLVFAGQHLFGTVLSVKAALAPVARRLPLELLRALSSAVPMAMILNGGDEDKLLLGLGMMLLMLYPILAAPVLFAPEVRYLEGLSGHRARERARALVALGSGRAVGGIVFAGMIRLLFVAGAYFLGAFALGFALQLEHVETVVWEWGSLLGYLGAGWFLAMARLLEYVDARTRREGWDIQVRFAAIAERARAKEAPRDAA
jgi:hypothetical protein